MATKPKKMIREKSTGKVRDLSSRKDPKGGAQKKEGPNMAGSTRGGSPARPGKTKVS